MTEYQALKAALAKTNIPFAEDGWTDRPNPPYGVYALDGQAAALIGDDDVDDTALSGTVDLYTLDNVPTLAWKIRTALRQSGVSWWLNSVQYEDDTRLHHLEYAFELYASPDDDEPAPEPEPTTTDEPEVEANGENDV